MQDIVTLHDSDAHQGQLVQNWAPPGIDWTDDQGIVHSGQFAFWSVIGAAEGAAVSVDPQLSIHVSDVPMVAVAVYLPGRSGRPGPSALYVDAFDVDQGRFFDDDFVTIAFNAALSANANETGEVPTTLAEEVDAEPTIEDVPFLKWLPLLTPTASTRSDDLDTAARTTGIAFALYQTSPAGHPSPTLPHSRSATSAGRLLGAVTVNGAGGAVSQGPL